MWKVVGGRGLALVPTLLLATFMAFFLLRLIPGDPAVAILGEHATQAQLEDLRRRLGLDQPLLVQFGSWLLRASTGDLGQSLATGLPVGALLLERLPATLSIVAGALIFSLAVGLVSGVAAAVRVGSTVDQLASGLATLGIAAPNFWLGMVLVTVFALGLRWFPATGYADLFADFPRSLSFLVLPAIALGASGAAELSRQARSAVIEVLQSDATRTLRAKGLPEREVVVVHALRNAGIPILTVGGLLVSRLLGGTVVAEAVFGIPGVGSLVVEAVRQRDYPVVQGVVLLMGILVLLTNFVVDVSYRLIDPRVRR